MEFTVEHKLDEETVESLLVSALEGGSNYWALIEEHVDQKGDKARGCKFLSDYILKGSGLVISNGVEEEEGTKDYKETTVTREIVQKALIILASKEPHIFKDIVGDNADAITGDALLQCCVLGEVVYG